MRIDPLFATDIIRFNGTAQTARQTGKAFQNTLQNQLANQMKKEIYSRFQIQVGGYGDTLNCHIPSNVLSRMHTDMDLKKKIFQMLEKYSGENFKESELGKGTPVKKCTLSFDEKGDMTAILETGTGKQSQSAQNAYLLYQKLLMQQASLMPYQMNPFSGYGSLYGLNSMNSFPMMQNFLLSSIFKGPLPR